MFIIKNKHMKTLKNIVGIVCCFIATTAFSQNYIPYYPTDWDFKNHVELIDFSQVKSLTSHYYTLEQGNEQPLADYLWWWNNTYQLTDYEVVNHLNKQLNFASSILYKEPYGNTIKAVKIVNRSEEYSKEKELENRQYSYGSFDVEKVDVINYVTDKPTPDHFEVRYEGNDDDFTQETIYTPQKGVDKQTQFWYQSTPEGNTLRLRKVFYGNTLSETDSLLLNQLGKKLAQYTTVAGVTTETKYLYKTRNVEVAGDIFDYPFLDRKLQDGKEIERYEYEYDAQGNWIVCKTYKMKNGKWGYHVVIKRDIAYRQ